MGKGFDRSRFSRVVLFQPAGARPLRNRDSVPAHETTGPDRASKPDDVWDEIETKARGLGAVVDTAGFADSTASILDKIIRGNAAQKPPRPVECCRYPAFIEKIRNSSERFTDHISEGLGADVSRKITIAGATLEPVLLTGETGTGKSWLARVIHERSRPGSALIEENVAGMTQSLFESRLKGHVKGAFTGAVSDSKGLLCAAAGGTLFLDEIGELPPEAQTQFLDLVRQDPGQTRFRPVGGNDEKVVDVRIIAATNKDVRGAIGKGELRRDLFYRFSQVIEMPSLADRVRRNRFVMDRVFDEMLFKFRMAYLSAMEREPVFENGREGFLRRLRSRRWPGNLRQVENVFFEVFRRFFILCEEDCITSAMIGEIIEDQARFEPRETEIRGGQPDLPFPLPEKTEEGARNVVALKKRDALLDAVRLGRNDDGKFVPARAARIFGCHPQTFLKLLKKHEIEPE